MNTFTNKFPVNPSLYWTKAFQHREWVKYLVAPTNEDRHLASAGGNSINYATVPDRALFPTVESNRLMPYFCFKSFFNVMELTEHVLAS